MQCRDGRYSEAAEREASFLSLEHGQMEALIMTNRSILQPPNPDPIITRAVHDAKLPLQMILCEIRLMEDALENLPNGMPPECRIRCASVFGNCYRLLRFINHFSDDAMAQSGRTRLHRTACELRSALLSLYASARDYAARCAVSITLDLPQMPVVVWADHEKFDRMVLNYLSNALKYTQPSGRIVVRLQKSNGFAVVSVEDDGCGVPPDFEPHLFERYRTIEGDAKHGSGLGLSIVRETAQLHGGDAFYEPRPGGGSRFSFCLPLCDQTPIPVENAPEPDYIRIEFAELFSMEDI